MARLTKYIFDMRGYAWIPPLRTTQVMQNALPRLPWLGRASCEPPKRSGGRGRMVDRSNRTPQVSIKKLLQGDLARGRRSGRTEPEFVRYRAPGLKRFSVRSTDPCCPTARSRNLDRGGRAPSGTRKVDKDARAYSGLIRPSFLTASAALILR